MNRRDFLRRAAIVAAGVVAADQLELLERLSHRKVFAGIDFARGRNSTTLALHDQHGNAWLVEHIDYPRRIITVEGGVRFHDPVGSYLACAISVNRTKV